MTLLPAAIEWIGKTNLSEIQCLLARAIKIFLESRKCRFLACKTRQAAFIGVKRLSLFPYASYVADENYLRHVGFTRLKFGMGEFSGE